MKKLETQLIILTEGHSTKEGGKDQPERIHQATTTRWVRRMGIFHAIEMSIEMVQGHNHFLPLKFMLFYVFFQLNDSAIVSFTCFIYVPKEAPQGSAAVLLITRLKDLIKARTVAPQYPADSLSLCLYQLP